MAEYWDIYDADRQKKRGTHLRGKPLADGDYHLESTSGSTTAADRSC